MRGKFHPDPKASPLKEKKKGLAIILLGKKNPNPKSIVSKRKFINF